MKKGFTALEIIFSLFVLVIVVLVLVRLFIKQVNVEPITRELDSVVDAFGHDKAYAECSTLCSSYQVSNCDLGKAVDFCQKKVALDLDGNGKPGEKSTVANHGGAVRGIPYCEDGMYCFHVIEGCNCGSVVLTPDMCDALMCEYYQTKQGFTEAQSKDLIKSQVNTGSCRLTYTVGSVTLDTDMNSQNNWWVRGGFGDCKFGQGGTAGFEAGCPEGAITILNGMGFYSCQDLNCEDNYSQYPDLCDQCCPSHVP